jgi:acyl dehydratase
MVESAELDSIVERLRSRIGMTTAPFSRRMEAGALIKFARSTGQTDPLYIDEEAARAGPYGRILAAPTYLSTFGNDILVGLVVKEGLPFNMYLHTDDAVEVHAPILAGDLIHAAARYADVYVRQGRNGPLLFQICEMTLTNQDGIDVAVIRVGTCSFSTLVEA